MTELETLKELKEFRIKNLPKIRLQECWDVAIDKFSEELKQSAIKDIKELIKTKGFLEIFDCEVEPLIEYIKWKNNITKEDLK